MPVAVDLTYFVLALGLSIVSSLVLARDIDKIGKRLRLPEPILGLLTAFGANAPEISVAIVALQAGRHDIGAGVVFGSNLFNLAALLGLSAVVASKVRIRRPGLLLVTIRKSCGAGPDIYDLTCTLTSSNHTISEYLLLLNGMVAVVIAGLAILLVDGVLPPWLALLLVLGVFLPYVAVSILRQRQLRRLILPTAVRDFLLAAVSTAESDVRRDEEAPKARGEDVLSVVPALANVGLSSVALVHTATSLGTYFGVSGTIIGVLVLATVTGLPNLVAALRLARRGRGSAVISESLNSNTLNIVIGLVLPALVVGIGSPTTLMHLSAWWVLALTALTLLMTARHGGLTRPEGIAVMLGYGAFVGVVLAR
jgi:cation:H+ antiporter